jgi:hypothetical protein
MSDTTASSWFNRSSLMETGEWFLQCFREALTVGIDRRMLYRKLIEYGKADAEE